MLKMARENRGPSPQSDSRFKLVLFCTVEGERFSFVLYYNNETGRLQD